MFFDAEHLVILFEPHTDLDIQRLILFSLFRIVGILDIFALPRRVSLHIHHFTNEFLVKITEQIETACHIDHRTDITVAVNQMKRRHSCGFRHTEVVSTECSCDMHYTRTVVGCHIITGDNTESTLSGIHPGN